MYGPPYYYKPNAPGGISFGISLLIAILVGSEYGFWAGLAAFFLVPMVFYFAISSVLEPRASRTARSCPTWVTRLLLRSRYPEQRLQGVKDLARSNRTPAVEAALDQALHDVSPEVRFEAAKTLLSIQGNNPAAMQLLILYLKDGSTSLRAAIALADARHSAATLADAGYQASIDLFVADLSVLPPLPAQHGTEDSFAWRPYSAARVLRILNWGRNPAERAMLAVAEGMYETASAGGHSIGEAISRRIHKDQGASPLRLPPSFQILVEGPISRVLVDGF